VYGGGRQACRLPPLKSILVSSSMWCVSFPKR
jgi:hypothetical protein